MGLGVPAARCWGGRGQDHREVQLVVCGGLPGAHAAPHLSHADVVPTPPDGPPTVALVTGRAITLTWNKPKWLDTAIGEGTRSGQGVGSSVVGCRGLCTDPVPTQTPAR